MCSHPFSGDQLFCPITIQISPRQGMQLRVRFVDQMLPPLGFAIVGMGRAGKIHLKVLQKAREDASVLWLVDTNPEGVPPAEGAKVTAEVADALADERVDCVIVSTPTPWHAVRRSETRTRAARGLVCHATHSGAALGQPVIRAALEAGKHVFAEKPLCCDAAEVREFLLTELAEQLQVDAASLDITSGLDDLGVTSLLSLRLSLCLSPLLSLCVSLSPRRAAVAVPVAVPVAVAAAGCRRRGCRPGHPRFLTPPPLLLPLPPPPPLPPPTLLPLRPSPVAAAGRA